MDEVPEFIGGHNAYFEFISKNLRYPLEAMIQRIQGKVFVGFVVEKDGTLTHIQVVRSANPLLDEEALRVVKLVPKWKPDIKDGKPVRSQVYRSISFIFKDTPPKRSRKS